MNDNPTPATSGQSGPEAAPLLSVPNDGSEANLHRTIDPTGLRPWALAAAHLHNLGLSPIPLVYRHKHPLVHEWTKLSITSRKELEASFPAHGRGNIGIRLGKAGWWPSAHFALADVDIDSDELLLRADGVLPCTPWVFGRESRPRSHRLYLVRIPASAPERFTLRPRKWTSHLGLGCLAELRGDGQQTMAPGSVHPDNHAVVWQPEDGDMSRLAAAPAAVDLQELIDAISALTGQEPDGGPMGPGGAPVPAPGGWGGPGGLAPRAGFTAQWATGVIGQQAKRVRRAEPGKRNSTLFLAALNTGSVVQAGLYPRPVAGRALLQAALASGLPQQEAIGTITSGFKAAAQRPVPLSEVGGWAWPQGVWEGSNSPSPPLPPLSIDRGGGGGEGTEGGEGLGGFGAPPSALPLSSFDTIDAQTLEWLWPGVLPLGKLVCLCGEPGLGKSFVVADIAARLSRGELRATSGESRVEGSAQTLILNAEDDPADTTRPRLEAARAVLSEVMCVDARGWGERRAMRDEPRDEGSARVPRDEDGHRLPTEHASDSSLVARDSSLIAPSFDLAMWETLDATLAAHPRVRLVVIDPVSAFFPDHRDSHKQTDVRRVLAPLTAMAQRRRVTVLLVAHLNKDSTQSDVHRVSGSTALAAACRAVWIVKREKEPDSTSPDRQGADRGSTFAGAPDTPDDSTTPRTMTAAKLNVARDTKELRFRVVEGERGARVVWE